MLEAFDGVQIPATVLGDLGSPERGVRLRAGPVHRAAVPEAAVDEHGHSLAREQEIGAAATIEGQGMVDAIAKAAPMDQAPHGEFAGGVASADPLHAGRRFVGDGLGQVFGHSRLLQWEPDVNLRRTHIAPPEADRSNASDMPTTTRADLFRNPTRETDRQLLRKREWPSNSSGEPPLRIVDLFAGAGGMSLGAFLAAKGLRRRFEVALAVEADRDVAGIYRANFEPFMSSPDCLHEGLLEELMPGEPLQPLSTGERRLRSGCREGGAIDLLMGGPPCQGHSDLNNKTRRDDERNGLYVKMARAAELLRPRVVIIENVRPVVHSRAGVVDHTEEALKALGYVTERFVLRFEELGVPQRRHRHVLVGAKNAESIAALSSRLDEPEEIRDVRWAIEDLRRSCETGTPNGFDRSSTPSPDNQRRLRWFRRAANRDRFVLPDSERPRCHQNGGHSYKAIYGRLDWNDAANTITTGFGSMGQGRYVHPDAERTITPHEAARLQTFPDFFRFDVTSKRTAWAKAIGNAVPQLGAREIVRSLLSTRT